MFVSHFHRHGVGSLLPPNFYSGHETGVNFVSEWKDGSLQMLKSQCCTMVLNKTAVCLKMPI